jgi:hypothetical protein
MTRARLSDLTNTFFGQGARDCRLLIWFAAYIVAMMHRVVFTLRLLACLRANDDFGRDDALSRTADFLSSCMSLENPLSVKGSVGNLIRFNGYT